MMISHRCNRIRISLIPLEVFVKVSNEVLAVLSRSEVSGPNVALPEQLERNLYTKVDKVLQAAGGKWNRKAKAHVFNGDAELRLEQIILTGNIDLPKDEFNYFPTPPAIVKKLIAYAKLQPGMECIEPSAGRGAIAAPIREAGASVKCVELMPRNANHLRDMDFNVDECDFLSMAPSPIYDRVIMNPPFLKQSDIKHVNHALAFLKPGGLLVAVMSAGVVFRENRLTSDFRDLVYARGGRFEELPDGSFKESGTMVNTVIVVIPA
jgi:predicted RNA methylase